MLNTNSLKFWFPLTDVGLNHCVSIPVLNAGLFGASRRMELCGPDPKRDHPFPHRLICPLTKYVPGGKYKYVTNLGRTLQPAALYLDNSIFKHLVLSVALSPTMLHVK